MNSYFFAHVRAADLVVVEVMPDYHVSSHEAAGGDWGSWPLNGADRVVMEREDAEDAVADDPHGYARIVRSVSALRPASEVEGEWHGVETASEWYASYGLDYVVEHSRDEENSYFETLLVTDEVGYSDLDGDDGDILVALTDEREIPEEAAEGLLAAARRVREAADRVAELCRDARDAAVAGDLEACLQALDEAYRTEADHGDCPMATATARACLREELFR